MAEGIYSFSVSEEQKMSFEHDGYFMNEEFVESPEVTKYIAMCEPLLSGGIDCGLQRMDLGNYDGPSVAAVEKITLITQVSDFVPGLLETIYFKRALDVARQLIGDDAERDYDQFIDKAPYTNAPTPWHQDAAYWLPGMPDLRSVNCWLALDEATIANGCMWFVPGSHRESVRKHRWAGPCGTTLAADSSEKEGVAVPLKPGSCTFHDGTTLHYTRGNSTGTRRRALLATFRPAPMVRWLRERGSDARGENERNEGDPVSRLARPSSGAGLDDRARLATPSSSGDPAARS